MAFTIKQNDTSPSLQATLKDAALQPIDLSGANIRFYMRSVDGTLKLDEPMQVVNALGGRVQYDWQAGDTDTVGTYFVEFEVTYSDDSVETFPNNGYKTISVVKELN